MNKIPLIYIGGCGHSGSTLLDLILGSNSLIVSVGEVNYYAPLTLINKTCMCSRNTATNCGFWREIENRFAKFIKNDGRILKENNLKSLPYLNLRNILKFQEIGRAHV